MWPKACAANGYAEHFGVPILEWVQTVLPDLRGKHCAPLEFDQWAGEIVFVPNGWDHAVLNLVLVIGLAKQMAI